MLYVMWFLVFVWLVSLVLTIYGLSRQRLLSPVSSTPLTSNDAPLVSVLIPARNEEDRVLVDCVRSILAQDYGRFEVIAVDDRSTDATRSILYALANADDRLHVIEGDELPSGWLGKPYAMHQALQHARGEWILATDADMIFDRSVLRMAVARMTEHDADAMTLIPHFETRSFWERVMIPVWAWVMLMFTISYRVNDPKSQGALGLGGFLMMRRRALERVGSYEALKNEVMEDVRLAEILKRSGSRMLVECAPQLLSTRMYRNFGEMWESCTKTWFAGMKFSLLFAIVCVAWMYFMAVVPPLAAVISLSMGDTANVLPALLCWFAQVLVVMMVSVRSGVSPFYSLTAPLGLGLLYAMLLDSSIRISTGKGVTWKGRRVYERAGVSPPDLSIR
jgi:chlorobactene glucosyltransferase